MRVEFSQIPLGARLWIYTSKYKIKASQIDEVQSFANDFLKKWESHGKSVTGSVSVIEDFFIVIAADDTNETLCGRAVDNNVQFIKLIEKKTGLVLLDRLLIAYKNIEQIQTIKFEELKNKVASGIIAEDAIFYNTQVSTKEEFMDSFEQKIQNSWLYQN